MNITEKKRLQALAESYHNPFARKYEQISNDELLDQFAPLMTLPGSNDLVLKVFKDLAKDNHEDLYLQFSKDFFERHGTTPAEITISPAAYQMKIQDLVDISAKHYLETNGRVMREDIDNWKLITENISNPAFASALESTLRDNRKSMILFNNNLKKAEKMVANDAAMHEFRERREKFIKSGGGKVVDQLPVKQGFWKKLAKVFDGTEMTP